MTNKLGCFLTVAITLTRKKCCEFSPAITFSKNTMAPHQYFLCGHLGSMGDSSLAARRNRSCGGATVRYHNEHADSVDRSSDQQWTSGGIMYTDSGAVKTSGGLLLRLTTCLLLFLTLLGRTMCMPLPHPEHRQLPEHRQHHEQQRLQQQNYDLQHPEYQQHHEHQQQQPHHRRHHRSNHSHSDSQHVSSLPYSYVRPAGVNRTGIDSSVSDRL